MHITCRNDRLMELFSEIYDLLIEFLNIFDRIHILYTFGSNHKFIVSYWLNLQIIIK